MIKECTELFKELRGYLPILALVLKFQFQSFFPFYGIERTERENIFAEQLTGKIVLYVEVVSVLLTFP